MKSLLMITSIVLLAIAAISTPIGIGRALYCWAIADYEIALALWSGFKLWITLLASGLLIGYPMYFYSIID